MERTTNRDDTSTRAAMVERLEDLREAVRAQTQALHTLIGSLEDFAQRLGRIERVLTPEGSGDNRLEELLSRIVAILQSNTDASEAIRTMLLGLPEAVARAVKC